MREPLTLGIRDQEIKIIMEIQDTISIVMGFLGIGGVVFTIYNSFKNPQIKLDKEQAITDKELDSKASVLAQKDVENKANLLAQQVTLEREANEKKFLDFGKRLEDAFLLASNHTHTVDVKVDKLIETSNNWHLEISKQLTELSTIIRERANK